MVIISDFESEDTGSINAGLDTFAGRNNKIKENI